MKLPKKVNRYCSYCNKKNRTKIKIVFTEAKRVALKRRSKERTKLGGT